MSSVTNQASRSPSSEMTFNTSRRPAILDDVRYVRPPIPLGTSFPWDSPRQWPFYKFWGYRHEHEVRLIVERTAPIETTTNGRFGALNGTDLLSLVRCARVFSPRAREEDDLIARVKREAPHVQIERTHAYPIMQRRYWDDEWWLDGMEPDPSETSWEETHFSRPRSSTPTTRIAQTTRNPRAPRSDLSFDTIDGRFRHADGRAQLATRQALVRETGSGGAIRGIRRSVTPPNLAIEAPTSPRRRVFYQVISNPRPHRAWKTPASRRDAVVTGTDPAVAGNACLRGRSPRFGGGAWQRLSVFVGVWRSWSCSSVSPAA